jgi:hypothetical protein
VTRSLARALAAASLTLAVLASPASAHKGNPNFRSYVNELTPRVPGVTLQVLNGDDRLELINRSNRTITVEGYNDEPYAQVLADGTVRVNQSSPATYLNTDRLGQAPIPPSADANAVPEWRTIDRTRRFEWHDHRIHWMAKGTPPQVKDKGKRTKVFDWAVPVKVGSQTGAIRGTLFWQPQPGGAPTGAIAGFVVLLVLSGAVVVVVRRRRGTGGGRGVEREAW